MNEIAIKCRGVNFHYESQNVLENIDFEIKKGEKIGIIGLNGSGKSTLLKLLIGLLKPSAGEILINGTKLDKKNLQELRKNIGYVFQNVDDQLFMPTVHEDISFGIMGTIPLDQIAEKTNQTLKKYGIEHLRDKAPFQLSGGEKRTVAIATVMIMAPEIILMDEPTEGLDAKMRRKMITFIQNTQETFVISSHDEKFIQSVCDNILVLHEGRLIRIDLPEVIYSDYEFLTQYELI